MDITLELLKDSFDVLVIQEPPWKEICKTISSATPKGEAVVGAPKHPEWVSMVRGPGSGPKPRIMMYVHTRLAKLRPSLRRDLINHRDISVVSFFGRAGCVNIMNVYSDGRNTAIYLLKEKMDDLPPLAYVGGDFNCHLEVWVLRP